MTFKTNGRKMKIFFLFLASCLAVSAQTNTEHVWTLKDGKTITGSFVSSGTLKVVIHSGGTNYFANIADLNKESFSFLSDVLFTNRMAAFAAETNRLQAAGYIEITTTIIKNFAERVNKGQKGWMDVTFKKISTDFIQLPEIEVGVLVSDKNNELFTEADFMKTLSRPGDEPIVYNPLSDVVLKLSEGDKIRMIGHCYPDTSDRIHELAGIYDKARFCIDRIEMISSAAEQKRREQQANF